MLRPPNKLALSLTHDMYSAQFSSRHILTVFLCFTLHWSLLLSSHAPSPSTLARARDFCRRSQLLAAPGAAAHSPALAWLPVRVRVGSENRNINSNKKILLITNLSSFTSGVIRQKWNMFDDKSASQRVCHRHLNDFAKVKIEITLNHVKCWTSNAWLRFKDKANEV